MTYIEGVKWEDATIYQRGERGSKPATAWAITFGGVRLWVSRAHRSFPGSWVMTAHSLLIRDREIGKTDDMDERKAKLQAIALARDVAKRQANELIDACKDMDELVRCQRRNEGRKP